jgi:hypothetical protein
VHDKPKRLIPRMIDIDHKCVINQNKIIQALRAVSYNLNLYVSYLCSGRTCASKYEFDWIRKQIESDFKFLLDIIGDE